jgi:hypothetical protein
LCSSAAQSLYGGGAGGVRRAILIDEFDRVLGQLGRVTIAGLTAIASGRADNRRARSGEAEAGRRRFSRFDRNPDTGFRDAPNRSADRISDG